MGQKGVRDVEAVQFISPEKYAFRFEVLVGADEEFIFPIPEQLIELHLFIFGGGRS
jgi:hypothetical protein